MFICHFCKKVSKPQIACKKIVTKSYMHQHPFRAKVQKKLGYDKNGRLKIDWIDDKGGRGVMIAQEVNSCTDCYNQYMREKQKSVVEADDNATRKT